MKKHELEKILDIKLDIHYQAQVNVKSNKWIGAEALIRGTKNSINISPPVIIQKAQDKGVSIELALWTAKEATIAANELFPNSNSKIGINVMENDIIDQNFLAGIEKIIKPNSKIHLELVETERVTKENLPKLFESIKKCHKMGLSVWIDDFQGNNDDFLRIETMSKMRALVVKIDRSITENLQNEEALLKSLNKSSINLIAEGGDDKIVPYYKNHGIQIAQGFHWHVPNTLEQCAMVNKINSRKFIDQRA